MATLCEIRVDKASEIHKLDDAWRTFGGGAGTHWLKFMPFSQLGEPGHVVVMVGDSTGTINFDNVSPDLAKPAAVAMADLKLWSFRAEGMSKNAFENFFIDVDTIVKHAVNKF